MDFDIAVTVEEGKTASGGGGLKVAGIGAKLEGESSPKDTRASRIQTILTYQQPVKEQARRFVVEHTAAALTTEHYVRNRGIRRI